MDTLVVIIQCDLVMNRCSGYNCMKSFYLKYKPFQFYDNSDRYMMMTCGGCCGAKIAAKLEDLSHHLSRDQVNKSNIIVYLASCICSDNYHRPPCPHLQYIKDIINRKGYPVILGTYISKITTQKRKNGEYKDFMVE